MNNPAIFPPKSYEPYQVRGAWLFVNKSSSYTWQKGTAKEQGHGGKSYQVFSLKHVYQFEENVGKISFKQILRNKQPCSILLRSPEPYQEDTMSR